MAFTFNRPPLLALVLVAALSGAGCSLPGARPGALREPAGIPGGSGGLLRLVLGSLGSGAVEAVDGQIAGWVLARKGAASSLEAGDWAVLFRSELQSLSRAEIASNPQLKSVLARDLESLGDEELAFLKSWVSARTLQRNAWSGARGHVESRVQQFRRLVERSVLSATDQRPKARVAAVAFLKELEPSFLSGAIEPELVNAVLRRIDWSKLSDEDMVESLALLRLMVSYHGNGLDPLATARVLSEPRGLRPLREVYLSAMGSDLPDPRLMAEVGRAAASEALVAERELASRLEAGGRTLDRLRWFTRNSVKASDLAHQKILTELDYLIRIGDRKAVRALVGRKYALAETAALYVQKYRELLAGAVARKAPRSELAELERVLAVQERLLGAHFEEYRNVRGHLDDLAAMRLGGCDAECAALARELDEAMGLVEPSRLAFSVSFEGMARPSLQQVQELFFTSAVAQLADMKKSVSMEALHALKTLGSSLVLLRDVQKLAARIPGMGRRLEWTKHVLFILYDARARHLHFPEISRIMRASGGIRQQLDMLEQMALPPNEDLLVTFARRLEDPVRESWRALKEEARAQAGDLPKPASAGDLTLESLSKRLEGGQRVSLLERMEAAEIEANRLGGISFHHEQSPAVKIGLVTAAAAWGTYAYLLEDSEESKQVEKAVEELEEVREKVLVPAPAPERVRVEARLEAARATSPEEEARARELERTREAARKAALRGAARSRHR